MPEKKESDVRIIAWPDQPATVQHKFEFKEACPVKVSFDDTPANVVVRSDPEQPLDVNMRMNVQTKTPFPVCIKLCEPICARSDYAIGITIFDRFVAAISIRGETRLAACDQTPPSQNICVDFQQLKSNLQFTAPFVHDDLTFTPLGEQIRTATFGEPAGRVKLAFPRQGVRVEFPTAAQDITLTVNNYAGRSLDFFVYNETNLLSQFTELIQNQVKVINIPQTGVTAIEIKGGDNEAAIVEICYTEM
jgi:hypothetical protein